VQKYNLTQRLLEKSKLAQRAYEEGHKIKCAGIKQKFCRLSPSPRTGNTRMSLLDHPISQPSLDISPVWTPIIAAEVKKLQVPPVQTECENLFFLCWYHKEYGFSPIMIYIMILFWCKATYVWSSNNLMFS
jgi:hypothetical protein